MAKKIKWLPCKICSFKLTGGEAKEGDPCPWCKRGILIKDVPEN